MIWGKKLYVENIIYTEKKNLGRIETTMKAKMKFCVGRGSRMTV